MYEKPEIDPHFWYGAYFSTYLERDVRSILNVGNLRDFDRFLRAAAVRTGQTVPLRFWRTGQGAEVDLLVEQGGRFVAVEAKFSEAPDATALKGLSALRKFYGDDSLAGAYVAARPPCSYPLSDRVQAVPGKLIDRFLS